MRSRSTDTRISAGWLTIEIPCVNVIAQLYRNMIDIMGNTTHNRDYVATVCPRRNDLL